MYNFGARRRCSTPKLHSVAHLFAITDCYASAKWLECAFQQAPFGVSQTARIRGRLVFAD